MHLVLEAYSPFELDFTGTYYISRDGNQIIGDHHIDGHRAEPVDRGARPNVTGRGLVYRAAYELADLGL